MLPGSPRFPLLLCCLLAATVVGGAEEPEVKAQLRELEQLVQYQKDRLRALEAVVDKASIERPREQRRRLETVELSIYPDPRTGYNQSDDGTGENLSIYGALDHLWLLVCATMVVSMQAGFACVETGVIRFKNVQNVLLKNQIDMCVSALCWYFLGYSLAYGESSEPEILRTNRFGGMDFATDYDGSGQVEPSREFAEWFFQCAFCATTATIVSGGTAERVNFAGYVMFSMFMTAIIYPTIVAWTWGTGWLYDGINDDVNFYDFAGSGVVHMTGGISALVAAAICGPRKDRWKDLNAKQRFKGDLPAVAPQVVLENELALSDFEPHSIPLQVLGTLLLWFGWYGFNCGSTLGTGGIAVMYQAALVAVNTTLAGSGGGLAAFALQLAFTSKYNISATCNGILAGCVSITAGCANVEPGSAIVIGVVGGALATSAAGLVKVAKIDDPVDAFAVHGICGYWGLLASAIFDMGRGFKSVHLGNSFACVKDDLGGCVDAWDQLFLAQIVGMLSISAFAVICTTVIFIIIRCLPGGLYKGEIEMSGADAVKHSPVKAYAMNVLFDGANGGEADTNRPPVACKKKGNLDRTSSGIGIFV